MINYETLLSSYDDKLTLLQWLKKVEEALKGASAVSFKVNKRGDATLTFSVVFEDGSELETSPIILQQGESVQGAAIRNGHLILTLTNGDELDAGNLGAVSGFSINDSQHLIVAYQNGTTQDLGAIFNGDINIDGTLNATKVTGDEIIENMNGYGFIPGSNEDFTYDFAYAGIVKNGNKLTCAVALTITLTNETLKYRTIRIGQFTLPASIGAKLYPTNVGSIAFLAVGKAYAFSDASNSVEIYPFIQKGANTYFTISSHIPTAFTANTPRFIRVEYTFLLSDNLAARG